MIAYRRFYGEMPDTTLALVNRYGVTAEEYGMLLDKFGRTHTPFPELNAFIRSNVVNGIYKAPRYY